MEYKAIGLRTKKIYAQGSRADCLRQLNSKFPSKKKHHLYKNKGVDITQVLPEEILITK